MVLCLENLRGGFCCCCIFISFLIFICCCIFISFLIFICWCSSFHFWCSFCSHLSMFFIHIYSSTSSLTLPWTIARVFTPHFICSAQLIAEWFATLSFSTIPLSSYRKRYGFEWAFFTHRRFFNLALLYRHCWLNLRLSRLPWKPAALPWSLQGFILIIETQTQTMCFLDSQKFTNFSFRTIHI